MDRKTNYQYTRKTFIMKVPEIYSAFDDFLKKYNHLYCHFLENDSIKKPIKYKNYKYKN